MEMQRQPAAARDRLRARGCSQQGSRKNFGNAPAANAKKKRRPKPPLQEADSDYQTNLVAISISRGVYRKPLLFELVGTW